MCEYCNKPYKNMSVNDGKVIIKKDRYSPSGYILFLDNSGGEYAECYCVAWNCPICGRKLTETENDVEMKPVIHAHAIIDWLGDAKCSNCGADVNITEPYCQHCGANFDEPEERED